MLGEALGNVVAEGTRVDAALPSLLLVSPEEGEAGGEGESRLAPTGGTGFPRKPRAGTPATGEAQERRCDGVYQFEMSSTIQRMSRGLFRRSSATGTVTGLGTALVMMKTVDDASLAVKGIRDRIEELVILLLELPPQRVRNEIGVLD